MSTRDALKNLNAVFQKKRKVSLEAWEAMVQLFDGWTDDVDVEAVRKELRTIGEKYYAQVRRSETARDSFDALRDVLSRPASARTWDDLRAVFDAWTGSNLDLGLQYARDHLSAWDDALRVFCPTYEERSAWIQKPPVWLPLVRCLDLTNAECNLRAWRKLAEASWLTGVTTLITPTWIDDTILRTLLTSPHLSHVSRLDMSGADVMPDFFETCFTQSVLPALEHLAIGEQYAYTETSLEPILRVFGARPKPLRSLGLVGSNLTNDDAAQLAAWPPLRHLEHLDLSFNDITAKGLRKLLASPHLNTLRELSLNGLSIDGEGVELLATSSATRQLQRLSLANCGIGDNAVATLLQAPMVDHLAILDLRANQLTDASATLLGDTPRVTHLRTLHLLDNPLTELGVAALVRSPHLRGLRTLDIGYNHVASRRLGDEALELLSAADAFPALQSLDLGPLRGRSSALLAFLKAPLVGRLDDLRLTPNRLSQQARLALAACAPFWTNPDTWASGILAEDAEAWRLYLTCPTVSFEARRQSLEGCNVPLLRTITQALNVKVVSRATRADLLHTLLTHLRDTLPAPPA